MTEKTVQILLVEDEEAHSELVCRAFEPHVRFNISVAINLKKAQDYLARSTPDLVITDLRLPDGSGIELLALMEGKARFPVVIMTSHGVKGG